MHKKATKNASRGSKMPTFNSEVIRLKSPRGRGEGREVHHYYNYHIFNYGDN